MRFVFMDEAGTSGAQQEKVRVVAAVIVNADEQLLAAEALLEEALQAVPAKFQDGFIFHAESIMNDDRYREGWRLTDRVAFLRAVMSIPLRLRAPIAFCVVSAAALPTELARKANLKPNEEQHAIAFQSCVASADKWIRENAAFNEVGIIVAENHDLWRLLGSAPKNLREKPLFLSDSGIAWRDADVAQGYCSQEAVLRVSRIRQTVHFVGKNDDKLVWLADACAYGLKRYFARSDFGDQFGQAIGAEAHMPDFDRAVISGGVIIRAPSDY